MEALRSYQVKSKLIWKCLNKVNTFRSHNLIWILWVVSYSGSIGNDVANELAKEGAGTPIYGQNLICEIGNGFLAVMVGDEEKQLRKQCSAKLPGR